MESTASPAGASPPMDIGKPLNVPTTTGGSFEQELRELLWQRCRIVFAIGLIVSLIAAFFLHRFVLHTSPELTEGLLRWRDTARFGHPISFALALGLLYPLRGRPARQIQGLAFAVLAANLLLGLGSNAIYAPDEPYYFAISLLLFIPAAFIPWPVAYQVTLGLTAVAGYVLLDLASYTLIPELRAFWARIGAGAFGDQVIAGGVGTAILAGVAVMASHTLYNLRKTAHRAKRLGNYIIHRELGRGGMGQVYVAQHALMCRPTAVKVLSPNGDQAGSAPARFEREVRLSSTLTHPNTITIYDFGRTQEGHFYYAMEYLEGLDLQEFIERFGPMPPERAVFILAQICGSLAEAHSRDIIHRDMKPSNVFLTRRGGLYDFVKVLDFGLAKQIKGDRRPEITKSGMVFGTPRYIAPESVYGDGEVDGRADLYNVGGIAYWMLTGQPPFISGSGMEAIIDHVKTAPRPPSEASELPIPEELDSLVLRCLAKRPEDRHESAAELERALRSIRFDDSWSFEKAREWWELHGLVGEDALDCECFAPEDLEEDIPAELDASQLSLQPTGQLER